MYTFTKWLPRFRVRAAALLVVPSLAAAQSGLQVEFSATLPYNVPLPLSIAQSGHPDINLTARYYSEPFAVPICWLWRMSYWSEETAWSVQAVHHKIYLENRPPEVAEFAVSHGLNLITLAYGRKLGDWIGRVGAGIVLAHPENTIRGKKLDEEHGIFGWGYMIAGPVLYAGINRQISLFGRLYLNPEALLHASYASVPVVDGRAAVWSVVPSLSLGIGYTFGADAENSPVR